MSFVAAFFALNVGSFPKGPDGTTTVWQIRHILGLVGKKRIVIVVLKFQLTLEVGISCGLSIPLIALAFSVNPLIELAENYWATLPGIGSIRALLSIFWRRTRGFFFNWWPASLSSCLTMLSTVDHKLCQLEESPPTWFRQTLQMFQSLRYRWYWHRLKRLQTKGDNSALDIGPRTFDIYVKIWLVSKTGKSIMREYPIRTRDADEVA